MSQITSGFSQIRCHLPHNPVLFPASAIAFNTDLVHLGSFSPQVPLSGPPPGAFSASGAPGPPSKAATWCAFGLIRPRSSEFSKIARATSTVWRLRSWQGPVRSILDSRSCSNPQAGTSEANTRGAPTDAATSSKTVAVSASRTPTTAGTPGLKIPAFSRAIAALVEPSKAQWSRPIEVITDRAVTIMFVLSSLPPRPVSITAASTP